MEVYAPKAPIAQLGQSAGLISQGSRVRILLGAYTSSTDAINDTAISSLHITSAPAQST